MKEVEVQVPVRVRRNGDGTYSYWTGGGRWGQGVYEEEARSMPGVLGHRAIIQAIDSGAFVDPLPTAVGSVVLIDGTAFMRVRHPNGTEEWRSSQVLSGEYWHTDEQVLSYGPFEVLYDPDNPTKKED